MMTTLTGHGRATGSYAVAPPRPRRRNGALAVAGILLVVGCAVAFTFGWLNAGSRTAVLALARGVTAGHVFSSADLEVVRVSGGTQLATIPASQEDTVLGRTAATALPTGSLLAPGDVGAPVLGAGQVLLGVAVKAGQYPPDLSAGQTVDVLSTATGSSGQSGPSAAQGGSAVPALPVGSAVVVAVYQQAASGETVVELQVNQNAMPQVAAASASGQIMLATIPPGG